MSFFKKIFSFYKDFLQIFSLKINHYKFNSKFQKLFFIVFVGNGVTCLVSFLLMIFGALLLNFIGYPKVIFSDQILSHDSDCYKKSFYLTFFFAGVLAPFVEELSFRLPLLYNRKNIIIAMLAVASLHYTSQLAMCRLLDGKYLDVNYMAITFFGIAISLSILLSINKIDNIFDKFFDKFWFGIYFVLSMIFGILHTNQMISFHNLPWIVIQQFPQIGMGFYLGYIRISYGIKWSILAHGIWNLLIYILIMLFNSSITT